MPEDPQTDTETASPSGDWLGDLMEGGLPQLVVGKHVSRALGRLIAGATDIPSAAFENVAQRIRSDTIGRRRVQEAVTATAVKLVKQEPDIARTAMMRWTGSQKRKQANREAIAVIALEDLADNPPPQGQDAGPSEDFMNLFEDIAERASSDELRNLLARTLAGEIRTPQSFSLRTLQFVSVMDQPVAHALQRARGWIFGPSLIPNVPPLNSGEPLDTVELLQDVSVLRGVEGNLNVNLVSGANGICRLPAGTYGVILSAPPHTTISISAFLLTPMGREIMSLLVPDNNKGTVQEIAQNLKEMRAGVITKATVHNIRHSEAGVVWGEILAEY